MPDIIERVVHEIRKGADVRLVSTAQPTGIAEPTSQSVSQTIHIVCVDGPIRLDHPIADSPPPDVIHSLPISNVTDMVKSLLGVALPLLVLSLLLQCSFPILDPLRATVLTVLRELDGIRFIACLIDQTLVD